jgi:hypothetical protein
MYMADSNPKAFLIDSNGKDGNNLGMAKDVYLESYAEPYNNAPGIYSAFAILPTFPISTRGNIPRNNRITLR